MRECEARSNPVSKNVVRIGLGRIAGVREAYYYFIQFEADATAPAEIESHMRIMDNVLRYLVVKKEA